MPHLSKNVNSSLILGDCSQIGGMRTFLKDNFNVSHQVSAESDVIGEDDPYPSDEEEKENRVYMSSYHFNDSFLRRFYELTKKIQKPGLFSGASSRGFRISCHEERTGDQGSWAKESALDFIPTIEVGDIN